MVDGKLKLSRLVNWNHEWLAVNSNSRLVNWNHELSTVNWKFLSVNWNREFIVNWYRYWLGSNWWIQTIRPVVNWNSNHLLNCQISMQSSNRTLVNWEEEKPALRAENARTRMQFSSWTLVNWKKIPRFAREMSRTPPTLEWISIYQWIQWYFNLPVIITMIFQFTSDIYIWIYRR